MNNKNRLLQLAITFYILSNSLIFGQQPKTLIKGDFAIRDFVVSKDSIFYIEKRDVYLYNKNNEKANNYFIGGYGIKLEIRENPNFLITASNELVDTVCSIRFYNKIKSKFEAEFYYDKAKILDFINIPEAQIFAISLTNKKVILVDYKELPRFRKIVEIPLSSLSRKLIYEENNLYFATDKGQVFKYNFEDYTKTLLYSTNALITEFLIYGKTLLYTDINGKISKVDLESGKSHKISLENTFISALIKVGNDLVCGSWNGKVYSIDLDTFSLRKEIQIHKRAILRLKKDKNDTIYSSGLDKTIKSWRLDQSLN